MEVWEIGPPATCNGAGSALQRLQGSLEGTPTPPDAATAIRVLDLAVDLAHRAPVLHDISDGGLAVALAEICIASGVGADIATEHPFSEDPHRFLALAAPGSLDLPADLARRIGTMAGDAIVINGRAAALTECSKSWHDALPEAVAGNPGRPRDRADH